MLNMDKNEENILTIHRTRIVKVNDLVEISAPIEEWKCNLPPPFKEIMPDRTTVLQTDIRDHG